MLNNLIKKIDIIYKNKFFRKEFKIINKKNLEKILNDPEWQVIDLRNAGLYLEHHLIKTTNIPANVFKFEYFKLLKLNKKALLISNNKRSNLDLYRWLRSKNFDVYILNVGYEDLRNDPDFNHLTKVNLVY